LLRMPGQRRHASPSRHSRPGTDARLRRRPDLATSPAHGTGRQGDGRIVRSSRASTSMRHKQGRSSPVGIQNGGSVRPTRVQGRSQPVSRNRGLCSASLPIRAHWSVPRGTPLYACESVIRVPWDRCFPGVQATYRRCVRPDGAIPLGWLMMRAVRGIAGRNERPCCPLPPRPRHA
jgi:hypothetical protein